MRRALLLIVFFAFAGLRPGPRTVLQGGDSACDNLIQSAGPTMSLDIPSAEIERAPIVHFLLEDNAASTAVVNKANAALAGAASANTNTFCNSAAKISKGCTFVAATHHVIDTGSDVIGTGSDSFCFWFNPTAVSTGTNQHIFNNGKLIFWANTSSDNTLKFTSDGAGVAITSVATVTAGTFVHICGIRDAAGAGAIYVNGVSNVSGATGSPAAGSGNLLIGDSSAGNRSTGGILDDVRIYDYALSPAQIATIYNNGAGHQKLATREKANVVTVVGATPAVSSILDRQGIEFTQATAANQPALTRGDNRENRIPRSNSLNSWSKLSSGTGAAPVVTENVGVNDQGNAYHRLQVDRGASNTSSDYSLIREALTAAPNHTFSVRAKSNDANSYTLYWHDSGDGPTFIVTPTWQTFTWTTPATATTYGFGLRGGLGTSAAADVLMSECQVRSSLADPTYIATTTYPVFRGMAGRRAVRFNGSSTYLTSTSTTGDVITASAATQLMGFRHSAAGYLFTNAGTARWYMYMDATPDFNLVNNDGSVDLAYSAVAAVNVPHVATAIHSAGNIYAGIDATPLSAPTASGDTAVLTNALWIGARSDASNFITADLQTLLTFNKALPSDTRAKITRCLCKKAGASC